MSLFFADTLVMVHLLFVAFAVAGGFLLMRWPGLVWLHLPAASWGAYIELTAGVCPLTPLENDLRLRGGGHAYSGDFVGHYLLPVLYPENLTSTIQMLLAAVVIGVNLIAYALAYRAWKRNGCGFP
jgi:hypothetical protein